MASNIDFNGLCNAITQIDEVFEENTAKAINKNVTARNWLTGYYIVHYEQNGNDRAKYGEKTLQRLAERLNKKSLSYRNLRLYRQFYMEFKCLARPVLEFTAAEFGSNRPLTADFGAKLTILPPSETDLANGVCQIGQHRLPNLKNLKFRRKNSLIISRIRTFCSLWVSKIRWAGSFTN